MDLEIFPLSPTTYHCQKKNKHTEAVRSWVNSTQADVLRDRSAVKFIIIRHAFKSASNYSGAKNTMTVRRQTCWSPGPFPGWWQHSETPFPTCCLGNPASTASWWGSRSFVPTHTVKLEEQPMLPSGCANTPTASEEPPHWNPGQSFLNASDSSQGHLQVHPA